MVRTSGIVGCGADVAVLFYDQGLVVERRLLARLGADAVSAGVERLLVNCIAATQIGAYVDAIASLGVPIGVYANAGREDEALGWGATSPRAAEAYAELAQRWNDAGASAIGGCCGTGPLHIQALADRFA